MFFISKLSRREKTVFYITAAVVGLALMNYFVFSPTMNRLNNIEYQADNTYADLQRDKAVLNRKEKITGEYQQYAGYFTTSSEKFQSNISQLALQSRLTLQGIASLTLTVDGKQRPAVKVNLEGEMDQIIRFLYAASQSDIIMNVETFHLRRKSTKETTLLCDLTISQVVIQ